MNQDQIKHAQHQLTILTLKSAEKLHAPSIEALFIKRPIQFEGT